MTAWFASMVSAQAPLPLQSPLQPVNALPAAGVATRLTALPEANASAQVAPQSMPLPDTLPVPAPALLTTRS